MRQVLPVHKVLGCSMAPDKAPLPLGAVGHVLVEQVVLSVTVYRPIRVVDPAAQQQRVRQLLQGQVPPASRHRQEARLQTVYDHKCSVNSPSTAGRYVESRAQSLGNMSCNSHAWLLV
eukprot:GHUV01045728.1.p1 GENE.GHUV01045728.1~~GHUV01045728.1.p1  ORF type:complete len:118 (-),score=10.91 GHUV01045728.1:450-803(-)